MYKFAALVVLFLAFATTAKSSHISYTEMTYKSLGNGYDYEFTVSLYADCGVILAPNAIQLNYCSLSCGASGVLVLDSVSGTGKAVFPICSYPTSICIGGSEIGYKKHEYKGIISFPKACNDWKITFDICCRSALINTIESPGTEGSVMMLHLDNLNYPNNSSPTFNDQPIVFACINEEHAYDQSATDIDGDSLAYSFYVPLSKGVNCIKAASVNYKGLFSLADPISTASGVKINALNGKVIFTPNILERAVMGIQVDEYRSGKIIGSIYRDFMITVTTESLLLGIKNAAAIDGFSLQPNPASNKIEVGVKDGQGWLRLYNVLGQVVLMQHIDRQSTTLDCSSLAPGAYFVVLQTQDQISRKQLIIE